MLCPLLIMFSFSSVYCQHYDREFDSLLMARFPQSGPGGVALVAKEGKVIYKKAFGMANLELDKMMTTDNVFRIGSNTKQFTAVAILQLAGEGKLSLQDEITRFIPGYPVQGRKITIEHLLTHTSGIKNYTGVTQWTEEIKRKDLGPEALIRLFSNEPMDFAPGEDFRYSNSGYILLGYIIERISGKPYAQYIRENIFQPLDMKNSFYDTPSPVIRNRASGYKRKNSYYENADFLSMTLPYAAGGLMSTADDLLTWYEALSHFRVIPRAMLEKAQTSYRLGNGRLTGYGYGWETGNVQGSLSVKHVGVINGFITYTAYLPEEKIFIALLSNCECVGDLDEPASRIAAMLLGKPYTRGSIQLTTQELAAYQGVYHTEYEGERIIAIQDGQLFYYNKGGQKSPLIPFRKDGFRIANGILSLAFERGPRGNVTDFVLTGSGLPLKGVRSKEQVSAISRIPVASQTLDKYVGRYHFPNFDFYIVKENDRLYGKVGEDKKEIIPFGSHRFFAKEIDATIIFNVDETGRVRSLKKIQNSEMTAERVE